MSGLEIRPFLTITAKKGLKQLSRKRREHERRPGGRSLVRGFQTCHLGCQQPCPGGWKEQPPTLSQPGAGRLWLHTALGSHPRLQDLVPMLTTAAGLCSPLRAPFGCTNPLFPLPQDRVAALSFPPPRGGASLLWGVPWFLLPALIMPWGCLSSSDLTCCTFLGPTVTVLALHISQDYPSWMPSLQRRSNSVIHQVMAMVLHYLYPCRDLEP